MPGSRFSDMMAVNGAALRRTPRTRSRLDKAIPASLNFIKPAPKPVRRNPKSRSSNNEEQKPRENKLRSSELVTIQEKEAYFNGRQEQEEQSKDPYVDELEAALKAILGE